MTTLDLRPAPQAAPAAARVRNHALTEVRLVMRNGEQLLLALVIPIGIVVAGRAEIAGEATAFILSDRSAGGLSPSGWAERALAAARDFGAGRIIVEANQGGEMARSVITQLDPAAPVKLVRATRGKTLRAEPVAALYERGRVRHVGAFARLEDQMTRFDGTARSVGGSPDRLDALVWAVGELMFSEPTAPRVRRF